MSQDYWPENRTPGSTVIWLFHVLSHALETYFPGCHLLKDTNITILYTRGATPLLCQLQAYLQVSLFTWLQ